MATPLGELVRFLDTYLKIAEVGDSANAVNGLQVEASTEVTRIALAVDAAERSVEQASEWGAELLLVHHGLFWSGLKPIVGPQARKLRRCFGAGLSVYSAHLPLDVHPECGNNAELLRALGLTQEATFAKYHGADVGLIASCDWSLEQFEQQLKQAIGPFRRVGAGPARIRRLGVITGGGGSFAAEASLAGLDALVTGEGAHNTILEAEERGLHLVFGGHYRTETFGVRALGKKLEERFGVETRFLEHDTGQ